MELLEIDRSVVLVIDMQGKLMEQVHRGPFATEGTRRLLRLAALFGVPVMLTEQYRKGLGPTIPAILEPFEALPQPRRYLDKVSFGCAGDPRFMDLLGELAGIPPDRRQVVVAGIEAHVCVLQTVLPLLASGHQVHLCWECVTGRGEEYRAWGLERMHQAGAIVTNHESVGFEWARTKDHASFKAMSAIFKEGQPV